MEIIFTVHYDNDYRAFVSNLFCTCLNAKKVTTKHVAFKDFNAFNLQKTKEEQKIF